MSWRVLRLNAATYPVEPGEYAALAKAGAELVAVEGRTEADILSAAADCDALMVVSSYVPATVIRQLPHCRTIARLGAGTDRIDIDAATQAGMVVSNVPDFCLGEQADHTMALLLSFARRLPFMPQAMRDGNFSARQHPGVHRLAGQRLGLIGFGASAQAVALTARERPTMASKAGSSETMSCSAVPALSANVVMARAKETSVIVAVDPITSDMKPRA